MAWSLSETLLVRANVVATGAPQTTDASNLSSGILADARLSSNIARLVTSSAAIKAVATATFVGAVAPQLLIYSRNGYTTLTVWQLLAAADAASDDVDNGILVPTDYNAGTNNFLWYQVL